MQDFPSFHQEFAILVSYDASIVFNTMSMMTNWPCSKEIQLYFMLWILIFGVNMLKPKQNDHHFNSLAPGRS